VQSFQIFLDAERSTKFILWNCWGKCSVFFFYCATFLEKIYIFFLVHFWFTRVSAPDRPPSAHTVAVRRLPGGPLDDAPTMFR